MLNEDEADVASISAETALKLRDDNCGDKTVPHCALPFKKRPMQPVSPNSHPDIASSTLSDGTTILSRDITEALEFIEAKVAGFYDIATSLGLDCGEESVKMQLEDDVQRVIAGAANAATFVIVRMNHWFDLERQRLLESLRRINDHLRASLIRLWDKYAGNGCEMSSAEQLLPNLLLQLITDIKLEQSDFFTNRPDKYTSLEDLSNLHTDISVAILKIRLAKNSASLVVFKRGENLTQLTDQMSLGYVKRPCIDAADNLYDNESSCDIGTALVAKQKKMELTCEKVKPCCAKVNEPWCPHCYQSFCSDCIASHIEKLKKEVIEMAEMAVFEESDKMDTDFIASFVIPAVQSLVEADSDAIQRELESEIADISSSLAERLFSALMNVLAVTRNEIAQIVVEYQQSVDSIACEATTLANITNQFVSEIRHLLKSSENCSADISKLRKRVLDKKSELCVVEQTLMTKVMSVQQTAPIFRTEEKLIPFLDEFCSNESLGSLEPARFAQILVEAFPDWKGLYIGESYQMHLEPFDNDAPWKHHLKTLEKYRRIEYFGAVTGPDCYGNSLEKPKGLTSMVPEEKPLIAVIHNLNRISIFSDAGRFLHTFKIIKEAEKDPPPLIGTIVADEKTCRLIFAKEDGLYCLDLKEHLDGPKEKEIVVNLWISLSGNVSEGLAVSSYRRELYTAFDDVIEAYSLDTATPLYRLANHNGLKGLQLLCFQWAMNGDMYLLYSSHSGNELRRKNLNPRGPDEVLAYSGWKFGHVSSVKAASCDMFGNLVVCDEGNSRVQVLSPQGKFIKSIIPSDFDAAHDNHPFQPRSVSIAGKSLCVTDTASNCIFIFKLPP